jgi:hypothetical protein
MNSRTNHSRVATPSFVSKNSRIAIGRSCRCKKVPISDCLKVYLVQFICEAPGENCFEPHRHDIVLTAQRLAFQRAFQITTVWPPQSHDAAAKTPPGQTLTVSGAYQIARARIGGPVMRMCLFGYLLAGVLALAPLRAQAQ